MSNQESPLTMTIEEVAVQLGIGRTLAYSLAQRNELPVPVLKLGRRLVVSRVALDQVMTQVKSSSSDRRESVPV